MSPTSPFDRPPFVLYPFGFRPPRGSATLHVHTVEPPSAALPAVADTLRRHDPTLAILDAGGMNDVLRSKPMLVIVRLGAALMGSFGLLGLLLAAVGLYGVVSHAVVQRKQEFGIRNPPLARPRRPSSGSHSVGGVALSILGLALGAVAASGLARLTAGFLVGVSPSDPAVFSIAGPPAGRCGSACVSGAVPARGEGRPAHYAASRIEPGARQPGPIGLGLLEPRAI